VPKKTLDRELGLGAVLAVSMGAMLGSGIFVLPGLAVAKVGPALGLAYVLSAVIVLPAALCKAELATALPQSGGTYLYVDRGIGPLAGTVVGLGTWFSLVFKSAFALVGLGAYLAVLFAELGEEDAVPRTAVALVICALLVGLNIVGVKKTTRLQMGIVVISLIGLTLFVLLSLPAVDASRYAPIAETRGYDLLATAGFVFVSFAGVTKICSIAEEVQDPNRTIPRGIVISLGLVTAVYALVSFLIVGVVDIGFFLGEGEVAERHRVAPLAEVAGETLGLVGLVAMGGVAILTLASMANSGLLTSSRFPLAMARDRLMPPFLSRISPTLRTPVPAILFTGGVMITLVVAVDVEGLAKLASAFQIIIFCVVNLTVVVIRESGVRWYRPAYRVPGYPVTPLVGILGGAALLAFMGPLAWFGAGGIVAGGLLWYALYARRRVSRRGAVSRLYGERSRVSQRLPAPRPSSGVTIPVFERDEDLETLLPLGAVLADEACRLQVLRIEEVPDQTALTDFEAEDPRTARIAEHVDRVAERYTLSCGFEDVVTHNAKHVLFERAVAEGTNWIVMSWQLRSPWRWFVTDPVAWFIHHPPSNLLLFREAAGFEGSEEGLLRFRRILVLVEPGPHDTLVVHVADRLAWASEGSLTFAYLAAEGADDARLREYQEGMTRLAQAPETRVEAIEGPDEETALLAASEGYDLVVLGAPAESEVRGTLRGSFEDRVTEGARCAVLRVKAVRGAPHASLQRPSRSRHLSESREEEPESAAPRLPQDPGFSIAAYLDDVEVLRTSPRTKGALFREIARRLADAVGAGADGAAIEAALWDREKKQPTALSDGVAIPHGTTLERLERVHVALWRLEQPVDFKSGGMEPIDLCFVVVGPPGARQTHLRILARIGQLVLVPGFLERVRQAGDPDALRRVVVDGEAALSGSGEGEGP